MRDEIADCHFMTNLKKCQLRECISGNKFGRYIPKWGIRICSECIDERKDGMHRDELKNLLKLDVPKASIKYNEAGNIIIPQSSEAL